MRNDFIEWQLQEHQSRSKISNLMTQLRMLKLETCEFSFIGNRMIVKDSVKNLDQRFRFTAFTQT